MFLYINHPDNLILPILFALGFLYSLLQGMIYKIVPFLSWFHLNSKGYFQIPTLREFIKEDSIKRAEDNKLFFVITDLKQDLPIFYNKIPPDLFRAGQGIIATGKFDKNNNIFIAQEILAKHDENYMPKEVKKSLEKNLKK